MNEMDAKGKRSLDPHFLVESNESFRLFIEAITDYAIYMLDPTGRIVSWNAGMQRIKGYSRNEVLGQHFSLFFAEEDIHRGKPARILEAAAREGKYQEEGWRVRKDGSLFWASVLITPLYNARGELQGFGKVTRDMTRWRESQEAVRQSEERFHLLMEGVRDYAIFMLDIGGHILTWNSGAQLIKGYTAAEIIGRHFSIFYPPQDMQDGKPERELRIAVAEGRYEEEGWRLRKNGSRFWANVLITALFDEQGQLRGFGKVTRDMTDRKLAEEQREQLREQEHQLAWEREVRAQMEAAVHMHDTFLAILAHELRTPLTSLLGSAQLLLRRAQREGAFSERDLRNIQVIVNQTVRLNEMVSLQLDISRLQSGQLHIEFAVVDVSTLARQVIEEVEPTLTKHTIVYTGPDTPLLVEGDKLRLIQVLQNLIQNAIKYSPAGGTVQVVLQGGDMEVHVAVSDEGIGIPQTDVPNLFQRFYRASNVDERRISGLGVGLYVVKELIALHGGRIDVVSEKGRGSTFIITLPQVKEQMVVQMPSLPTTPDPS